MKSIKVDLVQKDTEDKSSSSSSDRPKIVFIAIGILGLTMLIGGSVYLFFFSDIFKSCPESCDDRDPCTQDYCNSSTNLECRHRPILNCEEEKEEEISRSSRGNPNGPYYHKVYSALSSDGLTWEKQGVQGVMLFDHASVPGAVIKDDVIYLYFVDASEEEDQLSVGISEDLGQTFTKHRVEIDGMPHYDAVDPHPELVEGQIRLYYLGDFMSGHGMGIEEKFTIYSAVSDDGVHFTDQKAAYQTPKTTTDPDVFQTPNDWRMLLSQERELKLLISTDGGFTFEEDTNFFWDKGGVCDTKEFNGVYRTYYCGAGIQSATGSESGQLTEEEGARIDDQDEPGKIICDPSVIQLPDGSYMMFYKVQEASQETPPQEEPLEQDTGP